MSSWPIEIVRQSGWDLWVLVCAAASLVLLSYILLGKVWQSPRGLLTLILGSVGIVGTFIIIVLPPLHLPMLGMIWTFLLLADLSTIFYLNLRDQLSVNRTALLLGIRIVALLMLVPMLFDPEWHVVFTPKPEKPLFFLIDTSGSMSFPDVQNGPTRLQSVWQAIRPEAGKINDHFKPSYFTFDSSTRELKQPDELARLAADGKSTDIVGAIKTVFGKLSRVDSEVVVISDGIDNVSGDVAGKIISMDASGEPSHPSRYPVHTIRVGSDQAEPSAVVNVAVDSIEAPDDFSVDHEVTIKANIKSTALANRVVDVQMSEIDDKGNKIGELKKQTLVLQPTPDGQVVDLPYKAMTVGLHKVRVWIDPVLGESRVDDNHQDFQGLAIDPRIKVLYIEGSVRQEYGAIQKAMVRDSNIEFASYLRTSVTDIKTDGTVDGKVFRGLPNSAEGWKKFDVIIIGDVDISYLSRAVQEQIEKRVADGAGLLMIGGQNSFGPGGYAGTPIEKALPVFTGGRDNAQDKSKFVPRATAEGITHPILDGLTDWFGQDDKPAIKPLPPLNGNVIVARPKSGAQVLMVHEDRQGPDGKPEIVLAVQRYGQGRSAAFTADTTYLWYLPLRGMGQDSPFNKLWGQMIRWLAGQDVRDRQRGAGLEALLNKSNYLPGENVKLRARVRDAHGDATSLAQVSAKVTDLTDGKFQTLSLETEDAQPGMYKLILPDRQKGNYEMEVVASKDGKELGRQKLSFTVIPPDDEMLKLAANPKLLNDISTGTGGFHYELGQFPQLIDQLIRAEPRAGQAEEQIVPLDNFVRLAPALLGIRPQWDPKYDMPTQGLLIMILLITEWFLRRRWQLL